MIIKKKLYIKNITIKYKLYFYINSIVIFAYSLTIINYY